MNCCLMMNQEPVSGECPGWISVRCCDEWVSCEQRRNHHIKSLNTRQERQQITESSFQLKKSKEESGFREHFEIKSSLAKSTRETVFRQTLTPKSE